MTPTPSQPDSFFGLGLAPKLLEAVESLHLKAPTPIQAQAIPIAIQGQDVMGIAQTGTGKTFAFGLPMIQRLAQVKGRGLVVLPTRELALQVDESLQRVGKKLSLRTAVLIGGMDMKRQIRALAQKPHIIIGTPGRINDHVQQRTVNLSDVKILVLDEADRMLDMGFAPQINRIVAALPKERQTMLFSATMPQEITSMAAKYMHLPVRVEIARQGTTADQVTQELFVVQKPQKLGLLQSLLTEYKGSVLVFSRTKFGAKKIARAIRTMGHNAAEIHSNRSLSQRKEALEGFKSGKYRVLVATDIAARGIHVSGIELVLNFDLPEHADDYVHRIGRTGRAGREGHAISFATPDQGRLVRDIERLVRVHLPVSKVPAGLPHVEMPREEGFDRGGRGGQGRRPYGGGSRGGYGQSRGGSSRGRFERRDDRPSTTSRPSYGARPSTGAARPAAARTFSRPAPAARTSYKDDLREDDHQERQRSGYAPRRSSSGSKSYNPRGKQFGTKRDDGSAPRKRRVIF